MRIALVRKGLPPLAVNFLGCVHDHTELEVPDEDAMEFFSKATDWQGLRKAIVRYFGPRCREDWSSYLRSEKDGICGCCEAWLAFDRFTKLYGGLNEIERITVYPVSVIEGL